MGGEHDASQADPVVVFASSMPCDTAIRLHIDSAGLFVVVHVEDQALLGPAVARQCHHRLAPSAVFDQTLDLTH